MKQILDQEGIDSLVMAGQSAGGYAVQVFAHLYLICWPALSPSILRRLAVIIISVQKLSGPIIMMLLRPCCLIAAIAG